MSLNCRSGKVSLVGAGPGDPELMTIKGMKRLQTADVVVYDRLVNHELLQEVKDNCELVYVGKAKHLHSMSQQAIGELLVDYCEKGYRVVRLKGGDPFIFGRGGEEVDALVAANCEWEVVPGITAAVGAAASIGLPLTHRQDSQAVTFVTAHRKAGRLEVDWSLVLHDNQTVVFYMGLTLLSDITAALIAHGKSPNTPFTAISRATGEHQRVIHGTIESIAVQVAKAELESPTLLVMGPVPRAMINANVEYLADVG